MDVFTPEQKVINELFGRDVQYIIPDYQRPYSWDCIGKSDRNNQVNIMWEDLIGYFESDADAPYFFGSMVLIGNGKQVYQVIDGQQRLTTTVLLLVAIKCFLKGISSTNDELSHFISNTISLVDDMIFNKKLIGAMPAERKVVIDRASGFDFDSVFEKVMDCNMIDESLLKDATDEQKNVSKRYFNNKNYFEEKLKEKFTTNGTFVNENAIRLNEFIEFLKNRVSVVRILATNFDTAYHIFEILNNRGLPLSNKDLFRNFLIKKFEALKNISPAKYSHIKPNEKWNELENDLTDDFIARWVEVKRAAQQKTSAFNDLKNIYETNSEYNNTLTHQRIELFYNEIKNDLEFFTRIKQVDFTDIKVKNKLLFILNAGNLRYSLNFLLALSKRFGGIENNKQALEFIRAYELYILDTLLLRRFSSGPIYNTINYLNKGDEHTAFSILFPPDDQIREIKEALDDDILDNETGRLLISKYYWALENKSDEDMINQFFDYDKTTLEHILPQWIESDTNWERDFTKRFITKFTYKLGNMTLLTARMNSAARNFDFDKKKLQYSKTKLLLTNKLSHLPSIDEKYIETRHAEILNVLYEDLGI